MNQHMQAIATIFSLVNPAVCVMIFSGLAQGKPKAAAYREATAGILIVAFVLAVAALFGSNVLNAFGISLDAFSVAGGAVLIFIGFSMLAGSSSEPAGEDGGGLGKLVLFAASPGTITGVITIATAHSRDGIPVTALVAIALVSVFTWALLLISTATGSSDKEPSLGREMASRYMGLIIVAMGIQFALTGYKAFMAG